MRAAGVRDPLESSRWGGLKLTSRDLSSEVWVYIMLKDNLNFTYVLSKIPDSLAAIIVEALVNIHQVGGEVRPVLGHHCLEL